MIDESVIEPRAGEPLSVVRLYCDGTDAHPHERTQTHVLANGGMLGAWELVSGLREWQYVTEDDIELDERRGRVLTSARTGVRRVIGNDDADDVRARLVLRCGYCPRTVRLLRGRLEPLLDAVVAGLGATHPGEWEIALSRFSGK